MLVACEPHGNAGDELFAHIVAERDDMLAEKVGSALLMREGLVGGVGFRLGIQRRHASAAHVDRCCEETAWGVRSRSAKLMERKLLYVELYKNVYYFF